MVEFHEIDACMYGDREAIMINYFRYWISKNKANNKHFYDGHYWTYNSIAAFKKVMPYWSEWQIRNIINSLVSKKIIIEGNYNKAGYDKTKWYAFSQEDAFLLNCGKPQMDIAKTTNGFEENHKPIPISIPISKPISNIGDKFIAPSLEEVEEYCKQRNNKVNAKQFYDYYSEGDWIDKNGKPIQSWKRKMIMVWEKKAEEKAKEKAKEQEQQEINKYSGFFRLGNGKKR